MGNVFKVFKALLKPLSILIWNKFYFCVAHYLFNTCDKKKNLKFPSRLHFSWKCLFLLFPPLEMFVCIDMWHNKLGDNFKLQSSLSLSIFTWICNGYSQVIFQVLYCPHVFNFLNDWSFKFRGCIYENFQITPGMLTSKNLSKKYFQAK